jgi:hypothetical protein
MRRVSIIAAGAALLAGCSGDMPSFSLDAFKPAPVTMPLQFESEPQGAEVKTSNGQTCRTPCSLAVPAADLSATFSLTGYQPQTVAVKLVPPQDTRADSETGTYPQAQFQPSPVYAELVAVPPPKKPAPKKPKVSQQRPKPAAPGAQAPTAAAPAAPPPAAASPWPPAPTPIR